MWIFVWRRVCTQSNMWCCFQSETLFDVELFCVLTIFFSSQSWVLPEPTKPWTFSLRSFPTLGLQQQAKNLPTTIITCSLLSRDYKLSWTLMTSSTISAVFFENLRLFHPGLSVGGSAVLARFIFLLAFLLLEWFIVFLTHPIKKQFISIYLRTVLLSRTQSWCFP
jgi:hypothetical protein